MTVFLYYITLQVLSLTSLQRCNPFPWDFLPCELHDNWLKASTTQLHWSMLKQWSLSCGMVMLRCRSQPELWGLHCSLWLIGLSHLSVMSSQRVIGRGSDGRLRLIWVAQTKLALCCRSSCSLRRPSRPRQTPQCSVWFSIGTDPLKSCFHLHIDITRHSSLVHYV